MALFLGNHYTILVSLAVRLEIEVRRKAHTARTEWRPNYHCRQGKRCCPPLVRVRVRVRSKYDLQKIIFASSSREGKV